LYDFLNEITLSEFIKDPEIRKISHRQDTTASRIANMFPARSIAS